MIGWGAILINEFTINEVAGVDVEPEQDAPFGDVPGSVQGFGVPGGEDPELQPTAGVLHAAYEACLRIDEIAEPEPEIS